MTPEEGNILNNYIDRRDDYLKRKSIELHTKGMYELSEKYQFAREELEAIRMMIDDLTED